MDIEASAGHNHVEEKVGFIISNCIAKGQETVWLRMTASRNGDNSFKSNTGLATHQRLSKMSLLVIFV
jgi:hypothetical protein